MELEMTSKIITNTKYNGKSASMNSAKSFFCKAEI